MTMTMQDGSPRLGARLAATRTVDDALELVRAVLENDGAVLVSYEVYSEGETEAAATDLVLLLPPCPARRRKMLIEPPRVQDYSSGELVMLGIGQLVMGTPGGLAAMGTIGCEWCVAQARAREERALQESRIVGVRQ